jgi:SCP-2 sterol transfer family
MTLGGKIGREDTPEAAGSPFARLTPLVTEQPDDAPGSLGRLAEALATFRTPARIHLRLLDNEDLEKVDHWDVEAGSPKGTARRGEPKSADIIVVLRHDTWLEIAQGRISPYDALFAGKLRVGGNVELAKEITKHLSDPSMRYVSPC